MLAEAPFILHGWLRSGNTGAARGVVPFLQEALTLLPEGMWLRTVRADSGFLDGVFLDFLEERALPYVVVARLGTYTSRFNRRHKLFGHLFSGRYKSLIVEGSGSGYLKSVCDYVHLNPARAKLVAANDPLKAFVWSSWPAYLLAPSKRPAWLRVDRLLGEWGIPKDSPAGRQRLDQALEERRGAEEGEEEFRKELLAQMSERIGAEHYGEERSEMAAAQAEQIIAAELKRRRWREGELKKRPKGDGEKVAVAARLRAETTMTVGWIAERLEMGTRGHLNHLLYRQRKRGTE